MKSDPDDGPAEEVRGSEGSEPAIEPKPKKRASKKKAVEVVEASEPEAVSATSAEEVAIKPKKRAAAKKAAPVEAAEEATTAAEPVAKPAAKKSAKKKTIVAEEPVAEEVPLAIAEAVAHEEAEEEAAPVPKEEPNLERLQKILAHAGIASRRAAEEMILGGRVQINGKVVTELGTRADMKHDHIRVDGKLLQGPERTRYFVLNKPKGFVTTVSDPEGRPTVMQFFAGERERLYPVGRLDYLSEGLLLVTNDGELANKLTKASSGVEKTYLVKVAGQPTEEALDALRAGVVIERGRGIGSGRVRTAPAQIRQVREGDNPWYEVIVIEGRNRELRKMFEEIGHHVEKIRRVGYGPLILDLEPGKVRELEPEEVHSLRLAAEGKLKTRRRRGPAPAQLPTVAGKTVRYKKADGRPGFEPRPAKEFRPERGAEFRAGSRPAFKSGGKPGFKSGDKPGFAGRGNFAGKPRRAEPPVTDFVLPPRKAAPPEDEFDARPPKRRPDFNPDYKPGFRTGGKPPFRSEGRPAMRPGGKTEFRKDRPGKSFGERGRDFDKTSRPSRPRADFVRPAQHDEDDMPTRKTPGFRVEPVEDRPRAERPARPFPDQARPFRPAAGGPNRAGRPARPAGGDRPYAPRTERPAAGGKPFRPRTDGPPRGGSRPFRPASDRPGPDRTFSDRSGVGRGARQASEFRPRGESGGFSRSGSAPRQGRPAPRGDGPPRRTGGSAARPFSGGDDRPREFRSRTGTKPGSGPAKRFGAGRPASGPGTKSSAGPGGEPRKKERWRDSYTGKNKGRPKPKPKGGE